MIKKKLIFTVLLILTLTLALSGCGGEDQKLDGKNIVTFEMNGGTLNYGSSSTNLRINFGYHPGTYIVDPTTIYTLSRSGYNFTGWYTSVECRPDEKWNFSVPFEQETLVLYAGWEPAIKYTYTLFYKDGDSTVSLGSYKVDAGDAFKDLRKYADDREDHTSLGFYSDAECLTEWDADFKHPGGDSDLDIPVYVKYIEGEWELVDSYDKLKSAAAKGNVYLTSDIDCGGAELFFKNEFNMIFEGNGYSVSNFKVNKKGTTTSPSVAIFESLGAEADVRNVSFSGVTFNFRDIPESTDKVEVRVQVAALAVSMRAGAKVTDVSVAGNILTDYSGEFTCLNDVYYHKDAADADIMAGVARFTATITVDKQS